MTTLQRQVFRLSAAARAFVLVVLLGSAVYARDDVALHTVGAVGGLWLVVQLAERWPERTVPVLGVLEPLAVGAACGLSLHQSTAAIGLMTVPAFTGGLHRGVRGMGVALSAQVSAIVALAYLGYNGITREQSVATFTWTVTGLGLGLVACFVRSALLRSNDPLTPYYYAQTLIRQLIGLSGDLSSGLDPTILGGAIMARVDDELPTARLALYVPREDELVPLVTKSLDPGAAAGPADLSDHLTLAQSAWDGEETLVLDAEGRLALVLVTDAGRVGVVAATPTAGVDARDLQRRLTRALHPLAVQLDTALLFARFRDTATAEERRRLSREMHDGVAQDIASLGYLVDIVAASPPGPKQEAQLELLRERISAVVAEVRRTVITLRTSVGASETLGTAITSIARNLGQVSGIPIAVTLDEQPTRLRPEVEAELFRIAQEAMNNAVKHSGCTQIHVHCQVQPPSASITVSDNGRGMGTGRSDSYGLGIMQERTHLIGGILTLTDTPGGGLTVRVVLGDQIPDVPVGEEQKAQL
ncbi:histidine kinase [Nocardioides sp. TRM66260-LWL]|uniref:sensor histidine kinase n=1 Tax=Nocardioides sp. TRM66260-LWL TaxID=2874478 RepID=UPI001CC5D3EE|nr:histidine kinase [Nocardioides sp. TRM66260-LWL]MBZ5734310.1 histidine kinase [Nocardioides sp. TRM66260-LWL]